MSQTAPGWYPQPDGQDRYWDGTQWTEQARPSQAAPTAPPVGATAAPAYNAKQMKAAEKAGRPLWKKKRVLLPAGLLALAVGATAMNGGSDQPSTSAGKSSASAAAAPGKEAAAAPAGLGQTVKEGDAEFTIKTWKCGAPSVGKDYSLKKAQGMFCIADVVYKNLGKESKLFDTSALTARQGETKFAADSMASMTANTDAAGGASSTFLEQVNPGNSVSGKVVFDVPKTASIDNVYVLDGFTGEGTPIKVG